MAKIDINTLHEKPWFRQFSVQVSDRTENSHASLPAKPSGRTIRCVDKQPSIADTIANAVKALHSGSTSLLFNTARSASENYSEACGKYISMASVIGDVPDDMKELVAEYDKAAEAAFNAKMAERLTTKTYR